MCWRLCRHHVVVRASLNIFSVLTVLVQRPRLSGFLAHFFVVFQLRRRWERFFRHLCGELPRRTG